MGYVISHQCVSDRRQWLERFRSALKKQGIDLTRKQIAEARKEGGLNPEELAFVVATSIYFAESDLTIEDAGYTDKEWVMEWYTKGYTARRAVSAVSLIKIIEKA